MGKRLEPLWSSTVPWQQWQRQMYAFYTSAWAVITAGSAEFLLLVWQLGAPALGRVVTTGEQAVGKQQESKNTLLLYSLGATAFAGMQPCSWGLEALITRCFFLSTMNTWGIKNKYITHMKVWENQEEKYSLEERSLLQVMLRQAPDLLLRNTGEVAWKTSLSPTVYYN